MNLRLIAAAVLMLPVGAVMLAAGMVAIALSAAIWPFAYLRNKGGLFFETLLRELLRAS